MSKAPKQGTASFRRTRDVRAHRFHLSLHTRVVHDEAGIAFDGRGGGGDASAA